jgi:hypothetical protein
MLRRNFAPVIGQLVGVRASENQPNPPVRERAPAGGTTAPPPPRRKRRWGRRIAFSLVGLVVLLLILVGLGPTLLSLKIFRGPMLARVNAAINGSIQTDELALSWTGPLSARGLSISDSARREVAHIDEISLHVGFWQLLTGGLDFGVATIQNGRILLQLESDNSVSIANAFKSPHPSSALPKPVGGKLSEPRGRLVIKNVAVQIIRPDGRSFDVSKVDANVDVQTLDSLKGQVGLTLKDGGKLMGTVDVHDMVSGGTFAPEKAAGTVKLSTPDAIPVGPLALFAARRDSLEGTARLDIDAKFEGAAVRADVTAELTRILDKSVSGANASALDVGLTGDVTYAGDAISVKADITSSAGTARADARYVLSSESRALDAQGLIDAVLNGQPIQLPNFELTAKASIDLAAVERALPDVIKIKDGQKLTDGKLEIVSLTATGGASPSVTGSFEIIELASEGIGTSIRVAPVSCTFDAALQRGKGLEIHAAELLASFARVQASGTPANLKTDFSVDVQKLRAELGQIIDLSSLGLGGKISGKAALARGGDQRFEVELDVRGTQLTYADASQLGRRTLEPIDVAVKGKGSYDNKKLAVDADINTTAGAMRADAHYDLASAAPSLTTAQVLAAILSGAAIQLPEFDLKAAGAIDLAAVERAMPGLIKIKEGQKLSGGTLEITNVAAHGGASPAASGSLHLKDLSSQGTSGSIRIEPISLAFETLMQPGNGLEIKTAELLASFARIQASGAAANLKTTFDANLTKLKQELGQVVDFGEFELAGQINGTLNVARTSEERVDVDLQATGSQVRYSAGNRRIEIPTLNVQQVGQFTMLEDQPQRYTSTQTALNLTGQLEATATGYFDFDTQGYAADIDAKRVELAFLHAQLSGLGISALERYTGALGLTARVARESSDNSIATSGAIVIRALAVDRQPVTDRDATLTWTDAQFDPRTTSLRVAAAKLDSALANLTTSDVRFATGDKFTLSGKADATADLAGVLRIIARVAKMEKPPELAGRLTFSTTAAADGDSLTIGASGYVDQFVAGSGTPAVKQDRVSFEADARMDQKAERINLSQFKLTSASYSATMNGTIDGYKGPLRLALRGRYDSNWDQLTAIIHQLAPATAETIIMKGPTGSEFQITGALNDPAVQPTIRGLATSLDIGWSEARLYGIQTGLAKLSPALRDGKLTLPLTSIAASGGTINLRGVLDFQPAEPMLSIAGALPLLENIALNGKLAQDVLSWLSPVFMDVMEIEGQARLNVQDVLIPLGESVKRSGNGRGRLDLKSVRMRPAGLISELAALGGLTDKDMYSVQFSSVDFLIKDGRIHYDDFTMTFPDDFDLKFRGSVGFDSTLNLVVSLPVRPALLEKLGVKNIPPSYAQTLAKSRVELPLVGTRSQPRLDFSKVDTKSLLNGLIPTPGSPQGAVEDVLKGLRGRKPSDPKKGKPR